MLELPSFCQKPIFTCANLDQICFFPFPGFEIPSSELLVSHCAVLANIHCPNKIDFSKSLATHILNFIALFFKFLC